LLTKGWAEILSEGENTPAKRGKKKKKKKKQKKKKKKKKKMEEGLTWVRGGTVS